MTQPSSLSGFAPVARTQVPALGLEVAQYRHPCGAVHYHLACADPHRAFVVAFRTPPADSTGLPHILEHTTLCGSRRYPVRDPFFQMLRRSLQTFMNAMTFPDMTAYPFATQVAKDHDNLLDVYLDAVFAPRLDPLDFAQEGHRIEPKSGGGGGDGSGGGGSWERKGVVFNEMKGAMDSTDAQMEAASARILFADTCYRHNSGGEPSDIPRLRHRDLVEFHRRCYRPANACFITYGDGDPATLQSAFSRYIDADAGTALAPPTLQASAPTATQIDVPAPLATGQDPLDATATSLTWVWGDSADLDEALTAELLDRLLLGHAGAPLRRALEGSGLGRSIGSSGYGSSYRNGVFTVELEGAAPEDYAAFPPLVERTLAAIAQEGIARSEIDAALHQVEISRREIRGDHYPYGLELCFRLIGPWNHGVDPLPFLDQSKAIARLTERATAPGFVAQEIRRRFIDNRSRLWMRARPEADFHQRLARAERDQLAIETAALAAADEQRLRDEAAALAERQARQDDPNVLPDLALTDIPRERTWPEGRKREHGVTTFAAGTNGILHQLVAMPLPRLDDDELDLLPMATRMLGSLGVGKYSYAEQAARLNAVCGGLSAWTDIVADPEDASRVKGFLVCEVKGLAHRQSDFMPLIAETLLETRYDEHARMRELIDESLQRLQGSVQGRGHQLAARAAMRGFGGAAALGHRTGGLGRLKRLKLLAQDIADENPGATGHLRTLGERLSRLVSKLIGGERHLAVIGDAAERADVLASLAQTWSMPASTQPSASVPFTPPARAQITPTAYVTATAVNYCALVFPTVPLADPDAAALSVAGRLLTNNVLHPKIREQGGAYGAFAGQQSSVSAFVLASYRDPRLSATYADMRQSLDWLASCPDDARLFKEAILGVVADLDTPGSPAGEARSRFTGDLKGTGPTLINQARQRILSVTAVDVRRAAARWLPPEGGSTAVVTSADNAKASGLEWAIEQL
ncbi:MAG: insulinase family protein [Planctomycetes bacterium]|nr:insulinase family protein [Planctomycetota bacterium]